MPFRRRGIRLYRPSCGIGGPLQVALTKERFSPIEERGCLMPTFRLVNG
jgi:hypothetical protein